MKRKTFKSLLTLLLAFTMIFGSGTVGYAGIASNEPNTSSSQNSDLIAAYKNLLDYTKASGIRFDMQEEEFVSGYNPGQYDNAKEYYNSYIKVLVPLKDPSHNSTFSGKGDLWQYNTGTTLPQPANYSKYNLLNVVRPGDIIYEANGGFGITGHTAIVEGIFYSSTYNQYYIRVIEAIDMGVVRSVLDDERVDARAASVYRVPGASSANINAGLVFAISQLGDSYAIDFQKEYDDQPDWYCSELVWACYKRQGIDIETTGILNEPGVTPRDITTRSSKTVNIAF